MPLTTLTFGYEKPDSSVKGDVFWEALERNIQRMNDHNHDGATGSFISSSLEPVSADNWGADLGNSTYRQLITLPNERLFDDTRIEVRKSTGEIVYADIVKVSATTFYLYTNDNSASYVISYV